MLRQGLCGAAAGLQGDCMTLAGRSLGKLTSPGISAYLPDASSSAVQVRPARSHPAGAGLSHARAHAGIAQATSRVSECFGQEAATQSQLGTSGTPVSCPWTSPDSNPAHLECHVNSPYACGAGLAAASNGAVATSAWETCWDGRTPIPKTTGLAQDAAGRTAIDTLAFGMACARTHNSLKLFVQPSRPLHGMVSVMRAAESARDLLAAVTQPVSYTELAAHLARDYSMELFDSLSGLVLCHVDELNGPELSNLLWAYCTVGHRDLGVVTCIMQSLFGKLHELGPADLANTLWAMTRFGLYDSEFVSAASEQVWDRLPGTTPRQLASIVQSYAWFRQRDPHLEEDEDLLRSIAVRIREHLSAASVTDVALVLSGMARLRRSDPALLADASALLRAMAEEAELPALAEAIWACALLQHRDMELMGLITSRVASVLHHSTSLPQGSSPVSAAAGPGAYNLPSRLSTTPSQPVPNSKSAALSNVGSVPMVDVPVRFSIPDSGSELRQPQNHSHERLFDSKVKWLAQSFVSGAEDASSITQRQLGKSVSGRVTTEGFSALWPTTVGPGGRKHGCSLYERFNPSLPDNWQVVSAIAAGTSPPSGLQTGARRHKENCSLPAAASYQRGHNEQVGQSRSQAADQQQLVVSADAAALLDADVVSKLLWSYGVLNCYSSSLNTLLFRQLQRLDHDNMSWSALARLMSAQAMVFELQPSPVCRVNPLEAESVTAWSRLLRARAPLHKLPERYLPACFVAFSAERMDRDDMGSNAKPAGSSGETRQQMSIGPLSRAALQEDVARTLRSMGIQLRPSATVDGFFDMEHTALINGLTICLEVLPADSCTLGPPYSPMGPAVARLRSLEFRGWTPLVVPFFEWEALAPDDELPFWAGGAGSIGDAKQMQSAASSRQLYLRRKLEDLLGEELPLLTFPNRRTC